jgi:C4-dicarboxylate-specific signal transduction histidine kinase
VFFVSWISGKQRQAEEQLRNARDHLEDEVQSRTAELRAANRELQAEIADRKVAEAALQAIEAELTHVSRLTMMGELTASIAHEVNQPLGAIMNYANACRRLLAAESENRAQIDQALASIADDAHRASDVIARIRALSKKKPTERAPSGVKALIDDVVAIAKFKMLARGISVRVELGGELPPVNVDRVQIQQVLLNLIMNGMEAMEAVPAATRIIDISARPAALEGEPAVVMAIRDHGTGINPADQSRLFDAFYSTKADGLGLGLAISRSIVEAHGGRLCLVPTPGPGATFQILLPIGDSANS